MKIYLGSDHNGYFLRTALAKYLRSAGYDVVDEGDEKPDPQDDFPLFAQKAVTHMLTCDDDEPRAILICGSGQGMVMAANRYKGIRAALGYDRQSIRAARSDDDANVLALPANQVDREEANILVETFLNVPFADAPRFRRRIAQLDELPH